MKKLILLSLLLLNTNVLAESKVWTAKQANRWYEKQPRLTGANYIPASAVNELEMWQADTFDPKTIDRELGWAASLGMNTMRVFLHDLLWQEDVSGFKQRIWAISDHCGQAQDQADVCVVRFLLGSFSASWQAASAQAGRA